MGDTPEKLWGARYHNTLHGFEYGRGAFVVALTPVDLCTARVRGEIRRRFEVELIFGGWFGRHYFAVPEDDRAAIPMILDTVLEMLEVRLVEGVEVPEGVPWPYVGSFVGGGVMKPTRLDQLEEVFGPRVYITPEGHCFSESPYHPWILLQTRLRPKYIGGSKFSLETSERAALEAIDEHHRLFNAILVRDGEARQTRSELGILNWWHAREDLWITPEGKALARDMVKLDRWATHDFVTEPSEFLAGGWASRVTLNAGVEQNPLIDFPLADLRKRPGEPAEPTQPDQPARAEANRECMICLDAHPNTLVLPCQHVVVCVACSDKLADTPDAHTCVQCRRPITSVLRDE